MCGHGGDKEEAREPEGLDQHFCMRVLEDSLIGIKANAGMIDDSRNHIRGLRFLLLCLYMLRREGKLN